MALTTFNTTEHFEIMYDPVAFPNSIKRAQVLYSIVEQEFGVLCGWFGITDGFGPDNRIQVKAASAPGYGGQEGGYVAAPVPQGVDGMWINLDAQQNVADDVMAGERITALFVIEFSEILMAYLKHRDGVLTWNRLGSNGEGLSLFCGIIRYPQGYYSSSPVPMVDAWLQLANRENLDFVSTTEPTDTNAVSFGCALLFLFYLRSQLLFSESKIIQNGGSTLEDTYQKLTGASGGFDTFVQLLRPYFPLGHTPGLPTDNPFPLHALSFTITITNNGLANDGCQHRFVVVGSQVSFTAVISNLLSIYPATVTAYAWELSSGAHIVGPSLGKSVTIAFDSPGVTSVTVRVTASSATETVTEPQTLKLTVLSPLEAQLWVALCRYWQETRFIPQPVPKGDPAILVFSDQQLRQLEAAIGRQMHTAQAVHGLVGRVIQERAVHVNPKAHG
jgi:hypothetical protein